jgi:hypothetical protein
VDDTPEISRINLSPDGGLNLGGRATAIPILERPVIALVCLRNPLAGYRGCGPSP